MLACLTIRDFVIVDRLELEFAQGFTVFSGETGAGKSILIDALALVLGERADASVVRAGAARAEISAAFVPNAEALAWLTEHEYADGQALLVRRVVDSGARARAWINGTPATLAELRELGEHLVDIHGQHAHQLLLRPHQQRALLDRQAGLEEQVGRVGAAFRQWQRLAAERARFESEGAALAAERERLEWQLAELRRLALAPGEWDELEAEQQRLSHAASLLQGAEETRAALTESDGGLLDRLRAFAVRLEHLAGIDRRLAGAAETLEAARIQAQETVYSLNDYLGRVDLDPARLAAVEARLAAAYDCARKLRVAPGELAALEVQLAERLATFAAAADLQTLKKNEAAAEEAYRAAAAVLSQARAAGAGALAAAVTTGMQTLSMPGGRFAIELCPGAPSAHGDEEVEFQVAAHPGATLRPLAKVASGGELARISLAIAVIASTASAVPTLIFDEVDSGVGGAVAEVVGRLLRQLGRMRQVLCVTHLAQVAAQADCHFAVSKSVAQGETLSRIDLLDKDARIDELARMMGGIDITPTTRKHARELLAAVG